MQLPSPARSAAIALVVIACTFALTASSMAQTQAPIARDDGTSDPTATPFAPWSVWNLPLRADAQLDPQSTTYVAELLDQIHEYNLWINTGQYSTPVYTVPANQPTATVTLDPNNANINNPGAPSLVRTWRSVPIPANAQPSADSQGDMVVYQPSTNHMWEFWKMNRQADGWHAAWGGTIAAISMNPGDYPAHRYWGANGSGLPLLGGLIRPSELAAGQIDHAISLAIPHALARYMAWPALQTDGNTSSMTEIPEGQRFRLDPTLDLNTIPMAPIVRMMAVAAQKYGIIVTGQAGTVTFYAEDTDAEGLPNPYYGPDGYFENQYVNNLLAAFPWSHLEALKDTLGCCWTWGEP
jgi:hypothetical protein